MNSKQFLYIGAGVLVLAIVLVLAKPYIFPEEKEFHIHADFAVYLNGEKVDFAKEKYMSSEYTRLSYFFHLHDLDGNVMHMHLEGLKLGEFFGSIGMRFFEECFVLDNGQTFCEQTDNKKLRMFVNGKENFEYDNYVFNDLDRILITYGNESESEIQEQINSVTDNACIQSAKCPERGTPSDESSCSVLNGCSAT
ncbi:MAG TPA: hypothetical protein VFF13_00325 [archaeon]|nr:hypothetical protein [archaeon]